MQWYFLEIIPFFILASVLIWAGKITGIFDAFIQVSTPLMAALGLPLRLLRFFCSAFFAATTGQRDFMIYKNLEHCPGCR